MPFTTTRLQRLLPVPIALVLGASLVTVSHAATPAAGTIGPAAPSTTWDGRHYDAAVQPGPTSGDSGCPPAALDPADLVCDHYTLTVDADAAHWQTQAGGAEVTVAWADAGDDYDLYVYDSAGGLAATSANGGTTSETAFVDKAAGTYEVRVVPFLVTDSTYAGSATFVSGPDEGNGATAGGPASYNGVRVAGPNPDAEPQSTPARYKGKPLVLRTTDVGRESAEPTVGVDKTGTAFYAAGAFDGPGGLANTRLLRSRDGGTSWSDVTARYGGEEFPITFDPYVYVEEDTGRVHDLDLYVGSSVLATSDDQGESWETNPAASGPNIVNDHQTIFAGPAPTGFTTLDAAFPEILYYCFNRVADSACSRSLDGGKTFANSGEPAYTGFDAEAGGLCGGLHGHVATDPEGLVMVPKGHCGFPWISVSHNAGTTWNRVQVADNIDMPDNQSAVASDSAGNLFYVWYDSKHKLPWMATSTDHGRTWSDPLMIAPPGVHEVGWPTIAAGDGGRIAVTFPGTTVADDTDLSRPWNSYVVLSTNALAANPLFVSNIGNAPADPVHRGDCPGRCGNMYDFLDVIVSPADGYAWATAVDTCTSENACATTENADGFDEDTSEDNAASDMRGLAVRQVSGPSLLETAAGADCSRKKVKGGGDTC